MHFSLITATHHRPDKLMQVCLPSVLGQTDQNFEWVIVNDGANVPTRGLVAQIQAEASCTITSWKWITPLNLRALDSAMLET